jgi:Transposase
MERRSPSDTGNSQARAKTDRLDARTLTELLWTGELEAVWMPPEWTCRMRRRLARRDQLVRARSRVKNALMRCLKGRPPVSDLFGARGRGWLRGLGLGLPEVEDETVCVTSSCEHAIKRWLDFPSRRRSGRRLGGQRGAGIVAVSTTRGSSVVRGEAPRVGLYGRHSVVCADSFELWECCAKGLRWRSR